MLIYNFAKEFIGIDESDLKILGFSNLAQLRAEAADFADLFVRTPGHVHNFQHVHWIDFVECAESDDESKVIISVNSNTYKANLSIATVYLSDSANAPAYLVYLNNLQLLGSKENETISEAVMNKPKLNIINEDTTYIQTIEPDMSAISAIKEEMKHKKIVEKVVQNSIDEPLDIVIDTTDEEKLLVKEDLKPVQVEEYVEEEEEEECLFDPKVASKELGLPIDLIEEFVEDFIVQAKEFNKPLYTHLANGNLEEVAKLSHKLKGVAANLRIENALNALTTVNISNDLDVITTNLDEFYRIIARLAGEKVKVVKKNNSSGR